MMRFSEIPLDVFDGAFEDVQTIAKTIEFVTCDDQL